ncbi:hypothetical protein INT45_002433 [Circinella minor]|uniref:6-phosphofructo-2-kinase domain-containing protein n=1 Tax=Circinella minor TaxID=1195481 RepID=A0A8H7VNZ5_9FUNG|nr:hypothetical protein INT45_002433 [Circinella minor]
MGQAYSCITCFPSSSSKDPSQSQIPDLEMNDSGSPTFLPLSPCATPTTTTTTTSTPNSVARIPANLLNHTLDQPTQWLQLSPEISYNHNYSPLEMALSRQHRGSGFDVPGAVHSVTTPRLDKEMQGDAKLVIIMVGLPARGKSYIVKKLRRYLNWLQYETKVFNVGNLRRECESEHEQSAKFFDPDNAELKKIRDKLALDVLENLIRWLKEGGRVAIHDATNSTIERRALLLKRLRQEPQIRVLLLESLCTDDRILERNFRLKLLGPDYRNRPAADALADFKSRVANYEKAYQPIGDWEEERDIQYCKLINVGKKVIACNISGYLTGQCVFYLMNFNLADRQIFLTRHGQSTDNVTGRIGGDADLSPSGRKYAEALSKFIKEQRVQFALDLVHEQHEREEIWKSKGLEPLEKTDGSRTPEELMKAKAESICNSQFIVWTSMLKRAMSTAAYFDPDEYDIKHIRFLNEINASICEGMTYEEISNVYPDEYNLRKQNKLFYRYPGIGGESYMDVIHRTQSMIIELERMSQSCLIITHRVVMRILLGYLTDMSQKEMPHMDVPMHTVFEVRPKPYGNEILKWRYIEHLDKFVQDH